MENVFVIAELSANHNQDINVALKSIKAAKEAGASAVKIQTYTPDTITLNCDNEYFQIKQGTIWDGMTLYKLYEKAYTPWEWHEQLFDYAAQIGITLFSSPFDKTAVDFLEGLNNPIYKIASFEITDIPLIEYVASKKKPILISTGIATIGEIQEAIDVCRNVGNNDITLLKCTSSYPADPADINLVTMNNMKKTFNVKVGLSDHTLGSAVAIGAVALGAEVIEKHFIIDKNIGGPDSSFSMEPNDFKKMIDEIRILEKAIGKIDYSLNEKAYNNRKFSRSLFITEDIKAGEIFTENNIRSVRPGYGISPKYLESIIGSIAIRDYRKGEPFNYPNYKLHNK